MTPPLINTSVISKWKSRFTASLIFLSIIEGGLCGYMLGPIETLLRQQICRSGRKAYAATLERGAYCSGSTPELRTIYYLSIHSISAQIILNQNIKTQYCISAGVLVYDGYIPFTKSPAGETKQLSVLCFKYGR